MRAGHADRARHQHVAATSSRDASPIFGARSVGCLGSAADTARRMRIGVPKEIKTQDFRVGMTPAGVAILTARGHTVMVEQGAGGGSAIPDEAYVKAGAKIVATREEIWGQSDMVLKVK